jgi:hypothetical protein
MKTVDVISENALVKRIKRQLSKDRQTLHKCRRGPSYRDLGDYYVVDYSNRIINRGLSLTDPVDLGKSLGVMAEHETCLE